MAHSCGCFHASFPVLTEILCTHKVQGRDSTMSRKINDVFRCYDLSNKFFSVPADPLSCWRSDYTDSQLPEWVSLRVTSQRSSSIKLISHPCIISSWFAISSIAPSNYEEHFISWIVLLHLLVSFLMALSLPYNVFILLVIDYPINISTKFLYSRSN